MQTLEINILNPKAVRLLQDLADLKLISINQPSENEFKSVLSRLRRKAAAATPTWEEITKEVETVRAKRYAKQKAQTSR
jgi:hypothetical protein